MIAVLVLIYLVVVVVVVSESTEVTHVNKQLNSAVYTGDGKPAEADGDSETRDGCGRVICESHTEQKQRLETETFHTTSQQHIINTHNYKRWT